MATNQIVTAQAEPTEFARVDTYFKGNAQAGFETIIDAGRKYEERKTDYRAQIKDFSFSDGRLVAQEKTLFGVSRTNLVLTKWAMSQLCAQMGKALFGEGTNKGLDREDWSALRDHFTPQFDASMNAMLGVLGAIKGDAEWLVRGYRQPATGGDIDLCRAILSERYAPVNSLKLVESLWDGLRPEWEKGAIQDLRVNKSAIGPDDLHLYIVFKNIPDAANPNGPKDNGYGVGVYIGNGETGNRSLQLNGLIQRGACSNSIRIATDWNMQLRHIGDARALQAMLVTSAFNLLPVAAEALDKVYEAERRALPSFTDVLAGLGKQYGWDDKTANAVAVGTEGQETVMGIVNGVSYAAHRHIKDANDQADMELLAGKLLVAPDSLFARAAQIARVEVK
jgi:hypothetical protein